MKSTVSSFVTRSRYSGPLVIWAAITLEGLIALLWLLRVPSEPEAAVFLGYSRLRLLLAGGVLATVLPFAGLTWMSATQPPAWQHLARRSGWLTATPARAYTLMVVLFTLFVAILALLILMVSPAGAHSNALVVMFDRMGMVIVWMALIFAQLCGLVYAILIRQVRTQPDADTRLPYPLWGILPVIAAMVAAISIRVHLGLLELQHPWLIQFSIFLFFGAPLVWVIVQLVNDRETPWVFNFWAGVLLIGGAVAWGWFINLGEGPYTFHDWAKISMPRLVFLQQAVQQGVFPLHISNPAALNYLTDRFMGIPDVLLSPQMLLLRWMEIGPFLITNTILSYLIGFTGLIWFARRYRLSILPFTFLYLLFNFNGHIVAHLSVGHYTWTAYFLFPWLVYLVFKLLDGEIGWVWVFQVAVVLFVTFLQGGYHHFVYALFLLGLIALVVPRRFWIIFQAVFASVLLSAVRLLPVATNAGSFDGGIRFKTGFMSLTSLIESLVQVFKPEKLGDYNHLSDVVGSWELSHYLGSGGAIFLILFGTVAVYRNRQNPYRILLLPAFGLTLLSFDGVYRNLWNILPFPPITGERVAARIFVLALLIVLALAAIEFQRWYKNQKTSLLFYAAWAGIILLLIHDLRQFMNHWQVVPAAKAFEHLPFNVSDWVIANHPDPAYTTALAIGATISAITLVLLGYLAWREKQTNGTKASETTAV